MDFLNPKENKEIADAFLHFEGISDYFRYDKDGIIKGSIYFYKHCYNIMDNLFLMCQGCNGSKGSKDPLSWFLEQDSYFGEPFVQHVQSLGGLQEGVLFHRVYPVEERYLTISLEEGVVLHLPDELIDAKGLGIVVRDWFFEHYKDIFETHKFFYQENFKPLKKHLESLGKSLLGEHAEIATKLQLKLVKEMKTLFNIQGSLLSRQTSILGQAQAGGVPEYSSPSSQDSDDDAKFDRLSNIRAAELFRDAQKGIHLTRKVRRIIKRLYEKEMAEAIYLYMDNYFLRNNVLSGDEWQKMYIAFLNYMSDFNGHGKEPSAIEQELKLKLFELHEAEQEKHGVVRAEKLAAEHAISLKKDAKILELERQIALLKEAKEEKKEADKMDEDSPHDEESPPRSPSSTAPANSFFGKEEELKSDKKRKREEEQTEGSPPKHKFGKTGE